MPLLLLFLTLASPLWPQTKYTILTEELAPFGYTVDGTLTGLSVDLVKDVLQRMGEAENILVVPWARAYQETLNLPNHILFSMARTAERETLFKWVGPLIPVETAFFKRRSSAVSIRTLQDAKGVGLISVTRDFPEEAFLENQGFTNLDLTTEPLQNFKKLIAGRADLVPAGKLGLGNVLRSGGVDPSLVEETPVVLFRSELFIAFSRDIDDAVTRRWQQALDDVKKTSRYQELMSQYGTGN